MFTKSAGSADINEKKLRKVVYNLFWPESRGSIAVQISTATDRDRELRPRDRDIDRDRGRRGSRSKWRPRKICIIFKPTN